MVGSHLVIPDDVNGFSVNMAQGGSCCELWIRKVFLIGHISMLINLPSSLPLPSFFLSNIETFLTACHKKSEPVYSQVLS